MTDLVKVATIEDLQRWGDDASIMELGRRCMAPDTVIITRSELEQVNDDRETECYDNGHDDGYDEGHEFGYDEGKVFFLRKAKLAAESAHTELQESLDKII